MIHQAIDTGITDPTDCSADNNYPSRIDAYNRYNSPPPRSVIGHLVLALEQVLSLVI